MTNYTFVCQTVWILRLSLAAVKQTMTQPQKADGKQLPALVSTADAGLPVWGRQKQKHTPLWKNPVSPQEIV